MSRPGGRPYPCAHEPGSVLCLSCQALVSPVEFVAVSVTLTGHQGPSPNDVWKWGGGPEAGLRGCSEGRLA